MHVLVEPHVPRQYSILLSPKQCCRSHYLGCVEAEPTSLAKTVFNTF